MIVKGVPNLSKPNRDLSQGLSSSPIFKGVVDAVTPKVQAPPELISQTVLGAISTAAHGQIDVERIYGGSGPTSLFIITIAEPGERKSASATLVEKPIAEFDRDENKRYEREYRDYLLELEIYEDTKKHFKRRLQQALKSKNQLAIDKARSELEANAADEPKAPVKIQITRENSTAESLQIDMHRYFPVASLVSNEGATVLEGPITRSLSFLNSLWSGERFTVSRKTAESFTLENARLSMSILLQPSATQKFFDKKGAEAIGTGFMGRCLVCNPLTTQGTRFIDQRDTKFDDGLQVYIERMKEVLADLRSMALRKNPERTVIKLSPDVRPYALDLYNEIEAELGVGGRFQYAKELGNKLFENIMRIAALLSYFEHGKEEKISLGIFQDAEKIAFHSADTYLRCFQVYPDFLKDAFTLQEYCQTKRENGERYISKAAIRRSGPSRLRNLGALTQAVELVQVWGELNVFKDPTTGLVFIDLYPNFAHDPNMWNRFYNKYRCSL